VPGETRRTRRQWWYLLLGVSIHAGIDLFMEIGPFLTGMLSMYAACMHPTETRAVLARLARGFSRTKAGLQGVQEG